MTSESRKLKSIKPFLLRDFGHTPWAYTILFTSINFVVAAAAQFSSFFSLFFFPLLICASAFCFVVEKSSVIRARYTGENIIALCCYLAECLSIVLVTNVREANEVHTKIQTNIHTYTHTHINSYTPIPSTLIAWFCSRQFIFVFVHSVSDCEYIFAEKFFNSV